MINPQRAGMAHIRANKRAKAGAAVGFPLQGIGRRKTPDLTVARERIGRSADGETLHQLRRIAPAFATVRRRSNREISAEAKREARFRRRPRRVAQLTVAQPLQILMIADAIGVLSRETPQRQWFAVAQRRWPATPVFAATLLADGLETGETQQGVTALLEETRKVQRLICAGLALQQFVECNEAPRQSLLL